MKTIQLDMSQIGDEEDFYEALGNEVALPEYFGKNLDALADVITGDLELPLRLELLNLSVEQLEELDDLIVTLEDLEEQTEGFEFVYRLEQWENEE